MFFQFGCRHGKGIIGTKVGHGSLQAFRIATAFHRRRFRKGSYLRPPPTVGEDLLLDCDGS